MDKAKSKQLSLPAILGLGALGVALVILLLPLLRGDATAREFEHLRDSPAPALELSPADQRQTAIGSNDGELTPGRIAVLLQRRYAPVVDQPRAQIALIEELAENLRRQYPDDWVRLTQQILVTAFPAQSEELFTLAESLYRYSAAVAGRRDLLGRMTRSERRGLLWQIRTEYFGDRAVQIWAVERQLERLENTLVELAGAPGLSPDEKLRRYRERIVEVLGDPASPELAQHRLRFTQDFMATIQRELRAMSPEDRSRLMQRVRAELGMDAAALARWAALDRQRDQRWARGEIYTGRRAEILASYTGAEREVRLEALRRELFGDEAAILAREEAGGFFRYDQRKYPRRFGRE